MGVDFPGWSRISPVDKGCSMFFRHGKSCSNLWFYITPPSGPPLPPIQLWYGISCVYDCYDSGFLLGASRFSPKERKKKREGSTDFHPEASSGPPVAVPGEQNVKSTAAARSCAPPLLWRLDSHYRSSPRIGVVEKASSPLKRWKSRKFKSLRNTFKRFIVALLLLLAFRIRLDGAAKKALHIHTYPYISYTDIYTHICTSKDI